MTKLLGFLSLLLVSLQVKAVDFVKANRFYCYNESQELSITFNTSGEGSGNHLIWEDNNGHDAREGSELTIEKTRLGKLVSFERKKSSSSAKHYLSILIPQVNLNLDQDRITANFKSHAIKIFTKIKQEGPLQEHQLIPVDCYATLVLH